MHECPLDRDVCGQQDPTVKVVGTRGDALRAVCADSEICHSDTPGYAAGQRVPTKPWQEGRVPRDEMGCTFHQPHLTWCGDLRSSDGSQWKLYLQGETRPLSPFPASTEAPSVRALWFGDLLCWKLVLPQVTAVPSAVPVVRHLARTWHKVWDLSGMDPSSS